jgi:hypothetical protein
LYLANPLAAALREPDLFRLLAFHVPNLLSIFCCLFHTKVSNQAHGKVSCFVTKPVFMVRSCEQLIQSPRQRTTHCGLFSTAYTIYLQLPSILEALPPSTTRGNAMPWWQGPNYSGHSPLYLLEMHKGNFTFHDIQRK